MSEERGGAEELRINHLFPAFSRCVSDERMEAYRRPAAEDRQQDNDLETLTRYVWNICLSEALYPVIQILEVGLRNSIHSAAEHSFGVSNWYRTPGLLHPAAENMVIEAENEITSQGKTPEPGRVLAELNFGFWTNLLNKRYEPRLWPRLIKMAFPHMPAGIRTRHTLSDRFERIRRLRNRIFHHEPILTRKLDNAHASIVDAMGWINPTMREITKIVDRFPSVYTEDYYNELRTSLDK